MAINYDIGNVIRVSGSFTDPQDGDALVDPVDPSTGDSTVKVSVKTPAGTVTTYTYDVDAEVVRESAGQYYFDVELTTAGNWYVRFWSTETGQAAEELEIRCAAHQAVA